jgi:deazaflavin-dependent oxidoreductase (nitroreductase family)
MTAGTERATPPRILIRTFWFLHRAIVRATGGRFGITRPTAGKRFGMLRLTTVGRRSGTVREAMIGFYPDGSNLVTLAMNGWADADPAWWLNLQARPETTVVLPDGPRQVRARAARGSERDRLWARFRDYPGWGDDIDALAARRPRPTAVVVFEPVSAVSGEVATSATDTPRGPDASVAAMVPSQQGWRPRPRHLWLVPGLAVAILANIQATEHGLGILPLLAFGIAPHLPALAGVGRGHARGQLPPRAVPLFNAMHHPALPMALIGIALTGIAPPIWLVGAMAWVSHIIVDWALGDGMRAPDGFRRRLVPVTVRSRPS